MQRRCLVGMRVDMRVIWRSQALTIASISLVSQILASSMFQVDTPMAASCAVLMIAPAVAVVETAPTFTLSLRELFTPKPLATRRAFPFTASPTTFPSFSLVLEASDLESSGAVLGLEGGILLKVLIELKQGRRCGNSAFQL